MKKSELIHLLSFAEHLADVEVISCEAVAHDAEFINAQLYFTPESNIRPMVVPFVHHKGSEWLFTPCDWLQSGLPTTAAEVGSIEWRVNDTNRLGPRFDGVPMLSPWAGDPDLVRTTVRKNIGAQIRAAREAQGLSIREVADRTWLSPNNVMRIEEGRYNFTLDCLTTLAYALNITITIPG